MRFDSSSQAAPIRRRRRTAWRCPTVFLAVILLGTLGGLVGGIGPTVAGRFDGRFDIVPVAHAAGGESSTGSQERAQPRGESEQAGAEHSEGVLPIIARIFNFAVLAGALYYFLRSPIAAYLATRDTQIRQDLVTAAEMRAAATTELAKIDAKLKALPAELEALRKQGVEDVAAERTRIARAAAEESARLLEHTRREIQMQLRIARRELVEHAAQLAVDVARSRIVDTITPEDQLRLVDRYAAQLSEAR
jgi:F-type H+-transporting ATPase subunit b